MTYDCWISPIILRVTLILNMWELRWTQKNASAARALYRLVQGTALSSMKNIRGEHSGPLLADVHWGKYHSKDFFLTFIQGFPQINIYPLIYYMTKMNLNTKHGSNNTRLFCKLTRFSSCIIIFMKFI